MLCSFQEYRPFGFAADEQIHASHLMSWLNTQLFAHYHRLYLHCWRFSRVLYLIGVRFVLFQTERSESDHHIWISPIRARFSLPVIPLFR